MLRWCGVDVIDLRNEGGLHLGHREALWSRSKATAGHLARCYPPATLTVGESFTQLVSVSQRWGLGREWGSELRVDDRRVWLDRERQAPAKPAEIDAAAWLSNRLALYVQHALTTAARFIRFYGAGCASYGVHNTLSIAALQRCAFRASRRSQQDQLHRTPLRSAIMLTLK